MGVLALHHVAAHHGAADADHHHDTALTAATHDAEPAAGVSDDPTPTGDAPADLSEDPLAVDVAPGAAGESLHPVLAADSPRPGAGKAERLSLAILSSVLLLTVGSAALLALRAPATPMTGPALQTGLDDDTGPPFPVPKRLAQMQVLRV